VLSGPLFSLYVRFPILDYPGLYHLSKDTFSKIIRGLPRLRSLSLTIVKLPNEESITEGAIRMAKTNPRLRRFTLTFLPCPLRRLPMGFCLPFLLPYPHTRETGTYILNRDVHGLPINLTARERRSHRWPFGLGISNHSNKRTLDLRPSGYPDMGKRGLMGLVRLLTEKSVAGEELRMLVFCLSLVCLSIWGFTGSGRVTSTNL
jgi:hypothetical protein